MSRHRGRADAAVPFGLLMLVFAVFFPVVMVGEALVAAGRWRLGKAVPRDAVAVLPVVLAAGAAVSLSPRLPAEPALVATGAAGCGLAAAVFIQRFARRRGSVAPALAQFRVGQLTAQGESPATANGG